MNPIGGNNNALNNQLALNQKNALSKNVGQAQLQNAATIGRQVNKTQDDVQKTNSLQTPPKEQVTLSAPATGSEPKAEVKNEATGAAPQTTTTASAETSAKPASSKSADALTSFGGALEALGQSKDGKKDVESIITESGLNSAGAPAGEGGGSEVSLAATALRTALTKLQAKMPGASKEQIREAAKTDPEIAKWVAVADSAGTFLAETKAENAAGAAAAAGAVDPNAPVGAQAAAAAGGPEVAGAGPGGMGGPMGPSPFHLDPEKQAQMMADNVKTMDAIRNIYTQMWAEMAKARAQRHQLIMETANSINSMVMESHVNRMKSSEQHRKAIMGVILETGK